jgi:cytochrome P450
LCIGDRFALLEATLDLATLIRRAEPYAPDEISLAALFTIVAGGPMWVRIR